MSRKNEIKKDIWRILREVYCISEDRDITDKQNEFLNRTVKYLEENLSLRRKTDKQRELEVEDPEPLHRPEPVKKPEPVAQPQKSKKSIETKPKPKPVIDINALPPSLRKFVKV